MTAQDRGSEKPSVRPATVADAAEIGTIHVLAWRAAYSALLSEQFLRGLSIQDFQRKRRSQLADPGRATAVDVAIRSGRVVGFSAYGPSRDTGASRETGELYAIYLQPGHWRTGLGSLLHRNAMETLRGNGFAEATLWVLAGNERAQGFYTALGWSPDGTHQHATVGESPSVQQLRYRIRL